MSRIAGGRFSIGRFGKGRFSGRRYGPVEIPDGYVSLVDPDAAYQRDPDGAYLIEVA